MPLARDGLCLKVLWAFLLQFLGDIPGMIYGIFQGDRPSPGCRYAGRLG
jgi:hypothetical protein